MLSIIVATDQNNLIGKDNDMPWHIPGDLKRFKALTTGHTIVMGRKTYESLPKRPLPNRYHIVISRQQHLQMEGCELLHSLDEVVERFAQQDSEEVFVIGGAEIYTALLPYVQRLYLTRIHAAFEGDTYFPAIKNEEWQLVESLKEEVSESNPYAYTFSVLERQ